MARRLAQGVSVVQRDPESENRLRGMRSMEDVGSALVLKSEVALYIERDSFVYIERHIEYRQRTRPHV
jgi:hypothetical protein